MKLSKERIEKTVDYICDGIKDVIVNFGKRDPAATARERQEHFAEELANIQTM